MANNNAKERLYSYVDSLRESFDISIMKPLDAIALCKDLGANVTEMHFATDGLHGVSIPGSCLCGRDVIVLDAKRSASEKNFDCAHEWIHMQRHARKKSGIQFHQEHIYEANRFMEWEANEGAAELLVPYRFLLPFLAKLYPHIKRSFDIIYIKEYIAKLRGVTPAVVGNRIDSLSYEFEQYRQGVPLDKIEFLSLTAQQRRGIHSLSLNELEDKLFETEFHNRWGTPIVHVPLPNVSLAH